LFPHAFLGLLSMWVLTVAWTVQNGSGSGRIWTVYGPGAPQECNKWLLTVTQVLV